MSGGGWLEDHPRLTALLVSMVLGVVFANSRHPLAVPFLAAVAAIVYATAVRPEWRIAVQEDARTRDRRRALRRFMGCLERAGIEVYEDETRVECCDADPPRFFVATTGYGMTRQRLAAMCEEALPTFGAVRYTLERVPTTGGGYGYDVAFHQTAATEALEALEVRYEDIVGERPTYKRVPVGLFEDGTTAAISLDNRNALVGGLPRSGKSVLLSVLITGLCRCDGERIVVLSPKALDFQAFAPRAEIYQQPDEMLEALRRVGDEIERRKEYCERTRRKKIDRFTMERPHIAIIVDEYAVIRNAQTQEDGGRKPRKIGMEIEQELFAIVSQGAFSGCQVCLTSQRLSSNVISTDLRDICAGNLVSFANGSETSDQMIFGEYAGAAPASQIPIRAKGVGYLFAEGDMEQPRLFKCALTDMETEARVAEQNKERKPMPR